MLRDDRVETSGGWESGAGVGGAGVGGAGVGGDGGAGSSGGERGGERGGAGEHEARCEQLHRRLKRIVKARGSLDLQEAAALREAQQMGIWRRFGYASLVEYMEMEMGYSPRTALDRLRVANALPQLPQIAAAIESGELPFSGAKELTRVATPETESVWLGATREMNIREVEQAVSGHRPGDVPTDAVDPKLQTRFLRFEVRDDVYALLRQVQLILEKERGGRLGDSELVEALCRSVLDGSRGASGGHRGEGAGAGDSEREAEPADQADAEGDRDAAGDCDDEGGRQTAAYQVAVTVCKECKRGWQDGAGQVVAMTPAAVERALCDMQDIGALEGEGVQRAKQAIPPAVRRKVKRRDHGECQAPGCRSTTNIDVHHIRHREHGGTNELMNLVCMCESHHLAVHEGTLTIKVADGAFVFTREGKNAFTRATRAVDAARALRERGVERGAVREAIERTRAHVGTTDLTVEQWVAIAERYLEV